MADLILKIANCRGKKPVIRSIEKCAKELEGLLSEINPCTGKSELREIANKLYVIAEQNKNEEF